jgi:hypothetical protein
MCKPRKFSTANPVIILNSNAKITIGMKISSLPKPQRVYGIYSIILFIIHATLVLFLSLSSFHPFILYNLFYLETLFTYSQ